MAQTITTKRRIETMTTTTKRLIGSVGIALTLSCGFIAGYTWPHRRLVEQTRDAEYVRVVSAIARTMRCSTETEFAAGRDHECDPSEVEQDAGLTDDEGRILR